MTGSNLTDGKRAAASLSSDVVTDTLHSMDLLAMYCII